MATMTHKVEIKQKVYAMNDKNDLEGKDWEEGELSDKELVGEEKKEE